MDAPAHFGKGRQAMHEIPAERLMGSGVMLDVRDKAKADHNYALTVDDILGKFKTFSNNQVLSLYCTCTRCVCKVYGLVSHIAILIPNNKSNGIHFIIQSIVQCLMSIFWSDVYLVD